MTNNFWLDWPIMAVSLFNALLLLWLGVTVLLNAERRTWGMWLAGGGLIGGAAFFVSHTAILGHGLSATTTGMDFWWRVGWAPLVVAPFAWYALMLWYAGHWEGRLLPAGRHGSLFPFTALLTTALVGLLVFANPFPSYQQAAQLLLSPAPAVGGIPLLILVYGVYIVLSIGLSLDVLRRPLPSGRMMSDLARRRARPWLVAASATLLVVSLLVAWALLWLVSSGRQRAPGGLSGGMVTALGWFDLAVSLLIAISCVLLGQGIVSYEVFTGKALPRRGFRRYWYSAVILAAGCAGLISWSLAVQLRPVYSLLMTAALMILFYALLVWRSFVEREHTISRLRPFVSGQRLYDRLLAGAEATPGADRVLPLRALCEEVLGARAACLAALGNLAPMVGPPWAYPPGAACSAGTLADVALRLTSPDVMAVPLDPLACDGLSWAVPLWGERGLIGALLLGNKRDGGPYTQEEVEIARAVGERLIDTHASVEMARRLMLLQRQRLIESQLLDQRARRSLHDDILPRLHTAMLTLNTLQTGNGERPSETVALLADVHRQLSDLLRSLPASSAPRVSQLGLLAALKQAVEDELANEFDGVQWQVDPEAEQLLRRLPALTAEVVFSAAREAMRNAARHARDCAGGRPLHMRVAATWGDGLTLRVEDDGTGMPAAANTPESAAHGLALHGTMMAVVGGSLAVESVAGAGTRVLLMLPVETVERSSES